MNLENSKKMAKPPGPHLCMNKHEFLSLAIEKGADGQSLVQKYFKRNKAQNAVQLMTEEVSFAFLIF